MDLARISKIIAIDDIDGQALYTFLNKTITDSKKSKKRVKN
jgi:hypothetical protein